MDEMDTLDDLGVALRPAGGPAGRLRTRIADDLAAGTVRPLAGRRRFRPAVLAVPVAAAAVVAASLAITHGSAPGPAPSAAGGAATTATDATSTGGTVRTAPAAFTVAANADGSVTFTARDFVNTDAATRALRRAGLTGRVVNQQDPRGCPSGDHFTSDDLFPAGTARITHSNSVTMRSTDYPRGGGLFVAVLAQARPGQGSGAKVRVEILAFKRADRIPACVTWLYAG